MQDNIPYRAGLYLRLSKDDNLDGEKAFAKSMKQRKINSPISSFADIEELTPEILSAVIDRIEISHVKFNFKPGQVIHIYWKLS